MQLADRTPRERAWFLLTATRNVALAKDHTPVHRAADRFLKPLTVAVYYAFAKGRKALGRDADVAAATKAVKGALLEALPGVLLAVLVSGGEAGVLKLRAAAFNPEQERDEKGRWTHGVQVDVSKHVQSPSPSQTQAIHAALTAQPAWVQKELASRSSVTVSTISPSQERGGHVFFDSRTRDADVMGHLSHEIGHVMDYHESHVKESKEFKSAFKDDAKVARMLTEKDLGYDGHERLHYFTSSRAEAFAELYANTQGGRTATIGGDKQLKDYLPKTYRVVEEWVQNEGKSPRALELRTLKPSLIKPTVVAPLRMRFDARNEAAAAWVRTHAEKIADDISQTSADAIRAAVARAQEEGGLREQYDDILNAVGDENRAQLIARTESMAAANEGNRQAWGQAVEAGLLTGDERAVWIATSDACPECEALDGEERDLDGEYPDDGGDGPPLHPNCRCTEGLTT